MSTRDESNSEALQRREDRVGRAQGHIREAVEMLSAQVNDEELIGGALQGIIAAETSCRSALRHLTGLATNADVRAAK